MGLSRDFLSTSALTPATAVPTHVAINCRDNKKNAEGAQTRVLEPSRIELWQAELAREASNGRGIDALHRILSTFQSSYAADEVGMLDAINAMRDCAERHLDKHECETIDAIFRAVFPGLSRSLDDRAINLDAEQEIQRLAALPLVQYERERSDVAERLGLRTSVLDGCVKTARLTEAKGQGRTFELPSLEPWPDPVKGEELLDGISAAISSYVIMPPESVGALSLWVVHTHCFKCFTCSPRAAITSPEKQCGKTTTLDVLNNLVSRPLLTANATASAIFRIVEIASPTLLIDEADTFLTF